MRKELLNQVAENFKYEGFSVEVDEFVKPNAKLAGIKLMQTGVDNIGAIIYAEQMPDRVEDALHFLYDLLDKDAEIIKRGVPFALNATNILNNLDEVRLRVVKAEGNEEIMNKFAGFKRDDLYFYYYVLVSEEPVASFNLPKGVIEAYNLNEADLLDRALSNLLADGVIKTFFGMTVVTNKNNLFGASQVLNDALLQEICREFECGLVIIPSSIHEVLIMPEYIIDGDYEAIKQMIEEVNDTEVDLEDILSNHPYRYTIESGFESIEI